MTNGLAIETPRLRLVAVTLEALVALRDRAFDDAARAQGFTFSDEFVGSVNEEFLTRQIEGLRRRRSTPGWFVRAVLRKEDDVLVGNCGFHGTPEDVGRAEIGYSIFEPYRGHGYASESAQALVDWAREQGSSSVFATVAERNAPSLGVVTKLGFERTGVRNDGGGATEYVFELRW